MQRTLFGCSNFAHPAIRALRTRRWSWAAANIPRGGARRYIQKCCQVMPGAAEANVRAGFMLIPESGDSTLIKRATRQPAASPVKRVKRGEEEHVRTVAMSPNEIIVSATKATATPFGPGTVMA